MRLLNVFAAFLLAAANAFGAGANASVEEGELNGAKFAIAFPPHWNRQLLLIAHGLRPETQPLAADLSPDDLAYKTLLNEGWMVAKTSFRRNGIIVADAITDLDALRALVVRKYGQPTRVLIEGESLGGLLAVLIAERDPREPKLYDGVVAISAALQLKETPPTTGLSLQPKIPLLFLTNTGEIEAPKSYVASPFARLETSVPPAIFSVTRGGHSNVNQAERLIALRALNTWLDRGPGSLPRPAGNDFFYDATVVPAAQPSLVKMHGDKHGFDTRLTKFIPSMGALLDAQPADFAAAEIKPFTWFQMTVQGKIYRVFYGKDFSSVKRNEWVVFPHAEGNLVLARAFGDVASSAHVAQGDTISIHRFDAK
jgi:dienelactone hydrolase